MNRLTINLDNVTAWYEDTNNKVVHVITDGAVSNLALPDEILMMDKGKVIGTYKPEFISSEELMQLTNPIKADVNNGS